ncbi:MAG: peptide chain release factor N(5)-glutamine methyltransferase [Sphingomonadales bacterium]|nr:peptide chain release factor N(5)-glutamine methyltransferase [Sphingomonadales bacterium]
MGRSIRQALIHATARLIPVTDTPRLDAELLLAHALGITRERLILDPPDHVPDSFETLLQRRLAHEPLAYITGSRDFWTITLAVGPGVLIPRPDSETLIEAALAHFEASPPATVLDLGTGPGTLLLAALSAFQSAQGLGVDASDDALAYARRNAAALGLADRATLVRGDWGEGLSGPFDLILCNPPYVESDAALSPEVLNEPHGALFAGPDGLDDYRRLAPQISRLLAPEGCACVEIGYTQAQAVRALLEAEGLDVAVRRDLAGRDRCLLVRQQA